MPRVRQVAFFPNSWRRNPYLDLLEAGLREVGVGVHPTEVDRPFLRWASLHRAEIEVLHFHWLDYLYRCASYREAFICVLKFGIQLANAKRLGYRIVWTMHNLYPHERRYPHLDHWVRRLMLHYADTVLVHCRAGKAILSERFGREHGVFVAPLGNYIGVYPDTVAATDARERLGLPQDKVVLLFLGYLRAYKGLEQLVQSLQGIRDPDLVLVVAGKALDDGFADHLNRMTKSDLRISLRIGWIPDEEVPLYYHAADVAVCPFEQVLTSSSVMLALSLGCPVVVPALGCIPELVNSDVGVLYNPDDAHGLKDALAQCSTLDLARMGQNALSTAASYGWRETARTVLKAYTRDQ